MRAIGNFLWFIGGGVLMGLIWWLVGVVTAISIVGIPWAKSCFVIGQFSFFPFGKEAIGRDELTARRDIGTGVLGFLGNVVWFVAFGLWLALGHLGFAILSFVTIIGIPFGIQHLKLAGLSIAPIGKTIVTKELAQSARTYNADVQLLKNRKLSPPGVRVSSNIDNAHSRPLVYEYSSLSKTICMSGVEGHENELATATESVIESTDSDQRNGSAGRSGKTFDLVVGVIFVIVVFGNVVFWLIG